MTTNPPKRQAPKPNSSVILWLLDSDPSSRWNTLRALPVLDWYDRSPARD